MKSRAGSLENRIRWFLAFALAVALLGVIGALVGLRSRERSEGTRAWITAAAPPTIGPPLTVVPASGGSQGPSPEPSAQATAAAELPVLAPAAVPPGYTYVSASYVGGRPFLFSYRGPNGGFVLTEGPTTDPIALWPGEPADCSTQGMTTVQGQPAVWWVSFYNVHAPEDACRRPIGRWDVLELSWKMVTVDDVVGVRLQGNGLSLDQLVVIADSVQPARSWPKDVGDDTPPSP